MRVRVKTVNSGIALSPAQFARWCELASVTGKSRNTIVGELIEGATLAASVQAPALSTRQKKKIVTTAGDDLHREALDVPGRNISDNHLCNKATEPQGAVAI